MPAERLRKTAGRSSERAAGARVAELFEQHGRMVYGVCRLLLRDREEAEDATQQTFLSAYRSLLRGTEPDEPAAWLGTIARNECRGRLRARAAAPLTLVVEASEPAADVEAVADQREELAAVVDMLAELPPHQREAIVLREFYGLSHEEVGHALGVTPSAVDSLLVRARRRLQTALRPARLASGALVLPLALRESLAEAMPGFAAASGGGAFAKLASLPIAAKLTAGAATVTAVGVVAGTQLPPPPVSKQAPPPVEATHLAARASSAPPPPPPEPVAARRIAAFSESGGDADEAPKLAQRDDEDDQELVQPAREERDDGAERAGNARQPRRDAEDDDDDATEERRRPAEPEDDQVHEEDADEPERSGDSDDD